MSIQRLRSPRITPLEAAAQPEVEITKARNVRDTLARHSGLSSALQILGATLLTNGITPRRLRELVILRTGWNCQSEYEFGQHTLLARQAGVTDEEIFALTRPLSTHSWSDDERLLLQMADDLYSNDMVSNDVWRELSVRWSESEIIELLMASLTYRAVSGLLNTLAVQLDEGVPGWPSPS